MAEIKQTADGPGGFFDPHTHFTGVLPYRVLGILTPDGRAVLGAWRSGDGGQALLRATGTDDPVTDMMIEGFLAHHNVQRTPLEIHLDPPYKEGSLLSEPLYDLETRLMLALHLSLRWGLAAADAADFVRMQDNAATTARIITDGSVILQKYLPSLLQAQLKNISIDAHIAAASTLPQDKQAAARARLEKIKDLGIKELPALRPDEPATAKIFGTIAEFDYTEKNVSGQVQYEEGFPKIIRHLNQNVLTATPQNDYDSAYVARGLITIPIADLLDASARELARQKIVYSEQSVPLWTLTGKWKDVAPARVHVWESGGTEVRWLPMLVGSFLGWIGADHEPEEAAERTLLRIRSTDPATAEGPVRDGLTDATMKCIARHLVPPYDEWMLRWAEFAPLAWPPRNNETMLEDMATWIDRLRSALRAEVPFATGFDIASPERTWYTPYGTRHLIRLLRAVFEVAREQRRPLVAHIHVGEGYPAFADPTMSLPEPAAKRSQQVPLRILYDTVTGLPAHYLCGENNVEQALRAVGRFRRSLRPDELEAFDRYVCVRFGHVTHASVIQAQQMADYRIWADVNLTSNLATGALSLPPDQWGLPTNPGVLKQVHDLLRREDNARLFKHHALVTLLACGVPTVLGTDGGGIEHSDMTREYAIAGEVLHTARYALEQKAFSVLSSAKRELPYAPTGQVLEDLIFRLQPDRLYHYQWLHHDWTQAWREVPLQGHGPAPEHTNLEAELHGLFFSSLVGRRKTED